MSLLQDSGVRKLFMAIKKAREDLEAHGEEEENYNRAHENDGDLPANVAEIAGSYEDECFDSDEDAATEGEEEEMAASEAQDAEVEVATEGDGAPAHDEEPLLKKPRLSKLEEKIAVAEETPAPEQTQAPEETQAQTRLPDTMALETSAPDTRLPDTMAPEDAKAVPDAPAGKESGAGSDPKQAELEALLKQIRDMQLPLTSSIVSCMFCQRA